MADDDEKKKKNKSMMSILANLRKSFGNDAVFSSEDEVIEKPDVISTGSYALDDTIGIFGIPRGRITQLCGAEASGKSLLAMIVVKNWQAQDPSNYAVWVDAEFSFNEEWAHKLGLDLTRLFRITENLGTDIFDRLCGIPNTKNPDKKDKLGLLDEIIAAGDTKCGLIVIDSIASILPPVEASYEVGKQNMAAMARFMPSALRRISPLLHRANVALLAINQLRVDPGVQYGNPETSPGGRALKHHSRLIIHFAKVNAKDELILNANDEPVGHTVRAKIQKNSFSIPRDTMFRLKYLQGVCDQNAEMLDLGIKYGIIQRPNNKMYVYGDSKWNGRSNAEEALLDPELFNDIWSKVIVAKETYQEAMPATNTEEGE